MCTCESPPTIHLSVRTASHPSLVVKHCSLTSLIRLQLNHLSVCLTVCSLLSSMSVLLSSLPPLSLHFLLLCCTLLCHPAPLHLPRSPQSPSPPSLHSLSPHPLVRGVSEYNRVNHSHSEAVSLSIHSTAEAWNTLSSSTYHHAANTHRADYTTTH